jgi:hypothetical protein
MARLRGTLVTVALALLVASACTSGSGAPAAGHNANSTNLSAYRLVSDSRQATEAMRTARMTVTAHVSAVPSAASSTPRSVTMTGAGEMDLVHRAAAFTMHVPMGTQSFTMSIVMTGGVLYMRLPAQAISKIPGHKSWVKMDMGALAQQSGLNSSAFSQTPFTQFDPSEQLNYLRGVSRNVADLGTQTIRGVPTHHYRATIDLKKALARLPSVDRCNVQAAERQLGGSTFLANLWIDKQDRLRQMSMSFHMRPQSGVPGTASIHMTMDLFGFGQPVHVQAPPASSAYDITQRLASHMPTSNCTVGA